MKPPFLTLGVIGFPEILIGGSLVVVVALLVSFWPAVRGHWSAPVLAIPGLVGGLALGPVFFGPHTDLPLKLAGSVPTLLAVVSLVIWFRRRRKPLPRAPES